MRVSRKYWVTAVFGVLVKLNAWVGVLIGLAASAWTIGLSVLPSAVQATAQTVGPNYALAFNLFLSILMSCGYLLLAATYFIFMYVLGDMVHMHRAIEENTRQSAETLGHVLEHLRSVASKSAG